MRKLASEHVELWTAARVSAMHTPGPGPGSGCAQCQPDGSCPMLAWAAARLQQWERERGHRYLPDDGQAGAPGWHHVRDPRDLG